VALSKRDIALLDEEQGDSCLNDNIVNFFLKLAFDLVAPKSMREDMYIASTFFFQKLKSGGVSDGEQGWRNVRRWARTVPGGILAQRYIIVPINENNTHWWLAVICYVRHALPLTGAGLASRQPRIVCLDSGVDVPGSKEKTVKFLRGYIWREWVESKLAHAGNIGEKVTTAWALKAVQADVPKQTNNYDCGVFVIEYLLHLLQAPSSLEGLGLAGHRWWFGQVRVAHRRMRLHWIARTLQEQSLKRGEADVAKLLQHDKRLHAAVTAALTDKPEMHGTEGVGTLGKRQRTH